MTIKISDTGKAMLFDLIDNNLQFTPSIMMGYGSLVACLNQKNTGITQDGVNEIFKSQEWITFQVLPAIIALMSGDTALMAKVFPQKDIDKRFINSAYLGRYQGLLRQLIQNSGNGFFSPITVQDALFKATIEAIFSLSFSSDTEPKSESAKICIIMALTYRIAGLNLDDETPKIETAFQRKCYGFFIELAKQKIELELACIDLLKDQANPGIKPS